MSDERTHYLSCAPESYDSTVIYGVFDSWYEARDAANDAEYVSTSAEIQEWQGATLIRTWQRAYGIGQGWIEGWEFHGERRF